jgi:hypothetical protein
MDIPFPPAPPGYEVVLGARVILVAWSLIGIAILASRLRHWKSIHKSEIDGWWTAAGISYAVSFGATSRTPYDSNEWMWPVLLAAVAVSVAGITLGLCKIYVEGTTAERNAWIGFNFIAFVVCYFVFFGFIYIPHSPEASCRTKCKYNLKEIGFALRNLHDEQQSFVPVASGSPAVSWRVALLPYLDQKAVYDRYRVRSEWNSAENMPLAREILSVFHCPTNYYPKNTDGLWYTAYSMPSGAHSIGANPKGTKLGDITDGSSNTLLVVEACGTQIVWTEPHDVNIDSQPTGINLNGKHAGNSAGWLSSYHRHGTHVLLADGSVRFLPQTTDAGVLNKLATIDGGEQVDDF